MTEYNFSIKCVQSYTTGGTTFWEEGKEYRCKTNDFVSFRVSRNEGLNPSFSFSSFFELSAALFHEFFRIEDTLSKLPHVYDWMEEEFRQSVEETKYFEFVKFDVRRLGVAQGFALSDITCCAIAYNLLCEVAPEDEVRLYGDYLTELVLAERLRECG